ncbi:MAG TPA: hypothetical protein PKI03_36885, partial [Pseudomonadota bacterium]|nr:hypothetical protein [Pseudomonadota bacterium]
WGQGTAQGASAAAASPANPRRVAVSSEPFLFVDVRKLVLGPSIEGRPPQVVVQDRQGVWRQSEIATFVRPAIRLRNLYAVLSATPQVESLDARDEDLRTFAPPRFAIDRLSVGHSGLFLAPDLWVSAPHRIILELNRIGGSGQPDLRVVASVPTPVLPELQWAARLMLLVLLALAILGLVVWYSARIVWRRRALSSRAIPYIQGQVITDPSKFFGREALMVQLRDTIATTNYALLGEFRIGKTSLQKQLLRLLQESRHPTYVFFPLLLDLQKLGERGSERFFYFLATPMVQLARDAGLSGAALAHPQYETRVEGYDVQVFEADIERVLSFLAQQTAPRRPMLVFQIDEVMLMEQLRSDTRLAFRSLFIHHEDVKTVLTGPRLPKDEEIDRLSPWWNFLVEKELGPLTPAESRELILGPVRGLFRFDEDAIQRVIAHTQGKPLLLQTLCAAILQHQYHSKIFSRRVRLADVEEVIRTKNEELRAKRTVTRFLPGLPARGPAFYGRTAIGQRVLDRGWTWVCGQRRMGKTSILYQIAEAALPMGRTPFLFDLAVVPSLTARGDTLFSAFLTHQLRPRGPLFDRGFAAGQFSQPDPAIRFRALVERLLLELGPVVFLWDEAERLIEVERQDPGFLERLRASTHDLQGFQFVIAGTQILSSLYGQAGHVSPFLQTFSFLPIAGLSDDEAGLLLRRSQTEGWLTPLSDEAGRELIRFSGGHPLILQECGAYLAEETADDGARVDGDMVRRCQDQVVANASLHDIVRSDFAKLTKTQQAVLSAVCSAEGPLAEHQVCRLAEGQ